MVPFSGGVFACAATLGILATRDRKVMAAVLSPSLRGGGGGGAVGEGVCGMEDRHMCRL